MMTDIEVYINIYIYSSTLYCEFSCIFYFVFSHERNLFESIYLDATRKIMMEIDVREDEEIGI